MIQRLLLLCLLSLASLPVWAVTYTFNTSGSTLVSGTPAICSGSWSRSGTTFTCSGRLSSASGDIFRVSSATTIDRKSVV